MADSTLKVSILAVDKASKTLKGISKNIGGVSGALGGLGLAGAGAAVGAFAAKSVDAFQQAGGEALKLQRYMGGTIEDASRLGHAAKMSGIDSEVMAKSMGILSKNLAGNAKVAQSLGVSYRDANGDLKPMSEILPQLADKFSKMEAGPEKTALALKLFGKQGMALLPMLNKGSDGIKALAEESDALGTTLNDKDAAAVKQATANKRKMSEAIKGLQISIGKNLLPIVQAFVTWMTTRVVPAIQNVVGFLERNKETVVMVAQVLVPLLAGLFAFVKVMQVVTAVTAAFNVVMAMNPIGLVVLAIAALVAALVIAYKKSETFRSIVDTALRGVVTAFNWLKDRAVAAINWVKENWATIATVIKNSPIGIQVRLVIAVFKWLRDRAATAIGWIKDNWGTIANAIKNSPIGVIVRGFFASIKWLRDKAIGAFKWIKDKWGLVTAAFDDFKTWLASNRDTFVNYIVNPFITAFNLVSKAWNSTIGGLTFSFPDWLKYTGALGALLAGKSFTVPQAATLEYVNTGGGSPADARRQKDSEPGNKWAKTTGLAVGGRILSDGLALLHKGEVVMPYERAMGIERGGPTVIIQGGTFFGTDLRRAARDLNAALRNEGGRGLGLA